MTAPLEYAFISYEMASKEVPLEVPCAHMWIIVPAGSAAKVALDPSAHILLAFPFVNSNGFTSAGKFDWLWTEADMNVSVYKNRLGYYCMVRHLAIQTCQLVVNVVATTACKVEVQCKLGTRVAFKQVFDHDQDITSSCLKTKCKYHLMEEGLITSSCTLTLHWSDGGPVIRAHQLIWKPSIKVAVQRPAGKVKVRASVKHK